VLVCVSFIGICAQVPRQQKQRNKTTKQSETKATATTPAVILTFKKQKR